jgi:zinc transport system substrate-binding protein
MRALCFKTGLSFSVVAAIVGVLLFCKGVGEASDRLTVYAVNYPLTYFAQRIGGDHVTVTFPAPAHLDPAYWQPKLSEIVAFQKADLILLNGANYAKWVSKVSLPPSKLVNTSAAFKKHYITSKEIVTHSHGAEGEHAHEALAFTTWLDLELAAAQALAVAQAFAGKRPALTQTFEKNLSRLQADLLALDQHIMALSAKHPGKPLFVSHPVYDYLARRYRLNIRSVHWEPGEVPTIAQVRDFQQMLEKHPAQWMIWEGSPLKESVEKLHGIGIQSTEFDPCGNRPDTGDFLSVMQQNIANLEKIFNE